MPTPVISVAYTGDGATSTFSIPFDYLRREHVTVTVDGVAVTPLWLTSNTLSIVPAPASGKAVSIARLTDPNPLYTFGPGTIRTADLNAALLQPLYLQQEMQGEAAAIVQGVIDSSNTLFYAFTSAAPGALTRSVASKSADVVSVRDFGALGNSNGVSGNGHDDTAAIQAAVDYAGELGVQLFFPAGVYRTTAPITLSGTNHVYRLTGAGYASKLFNDSSVPCHTLSSAAASLAATALLPALIVEKLNFIAPTNSAVGNLAIAATNQQHVVIRENYIDGYYTAIQLATSYAPSILGNTITGSHATAIYLPDDNTANNAKIIGNRIFSCGFTTSDAAIYVGGGTSGSASSALVLEQNNIESCFGGVIFGKIVGFSICGNSIEAQTSYNLYFITTATAGRMQSNWFGGAVDTQLDMSGSLIGPNSGGGWNVSWTAGSTGNEFKSNPSGWATPPA